MNQQIAVWQCLTLQEFCSQCDWEGKLFNASLSEPSTPNSQPQIQASSQPLSIESFDPSTWMSLTVQGFFSHSNWLGQPCSLRREAVSVESQIDSPSFLPLQVTCSLTSSVDEFFQFMDWEGQPDIATPPISAQKTPQLSDADQITLTDLSNLF
jgi:hypothetical protein